MLRIFKHGLIRDIYITVLSFIIGVMFVVRCGGSANSIAEAVSNALGIPFSDSSAVLSSTNVQDAISEMVAYMPIVKDANGQIVGVEFYSGPAADNPMVIWNKEIKAWITIDPITGSYAYDADLRTTLYFTEADCGGTPYISYTESLYNPYYQTVVPNNSHYYKQKFSTSQRFVGTPDSSSDTFISNRTENGTCTNTGGGSALVASGVDVGHTFVEAVEITNMPTFVGPFTIGE